MKRILVLLGTVLMAVFTIVACGREEPAVTTEITTVSDTSFEVAETTEPITIDIVVNGKAVFNIVRDDDAAPASLVVSQARSVIDQIKSLTGATAKLNTDWSQKGAELDSSTYEILVGLTDYSETRQVMETLKYGECAVRLVGNKIVVFGYTDSTMSQAVSYLNRVLKKATSEDGRSITITAEDLEYFKSTDGRMNALPVYEEGTFISHYKAGNQVDEFIVGDTSPDEYRDYLKKLEEAGFACYTTHQITDNLFATYTNDQYTVTAGYYDYEKSVRLLIEPLAPAVGLESENVYTSVTTSQLTMLGLEYKNGDGSYTSNGLSVLIRLTDGRFIIVDGGFNRAKHSEELMRHLREQSAGYAKSMKDITIAAWIITHPHGDHDGLLIGKHTDFMGITVERVLVNFLSEVEMTKGETNSEYQDVLLAAWTLDATIHQIHVGQVFWFADLKMEVLYTIESFGPRVCTGSNTTSVILRMEFGGETVYLSTGDASGDGMEICARMYGDYLQSDIIQVCHHGYDTWGNDAGTMKAYRTINAPTVLWPQGLNDYPICKIKEHNAVLFDVPNYKEVYVSGAEGDSITLPIPYTVGAAIENRTAG